MNARQLIARGQDNGLSSAHIGLVVALVALVLLGLGLVAALFFLRSMRRARRQASNSSLPQYNDVASRRSHLTITTDRKSMLVYSEKEGLMDSPTSPVPEIRITFPDEVDETGKCQSGRVVVVRVGEHSVGLEPVGDDALPAYARDAEGARFDSLDLDRIGGLKEKSDKDYS